MYLRTTLSSTVAADVAAGKVACAAGTIKLVVREYTSTATAAD